MPATTTIAALCLLLPLAAVIGFYDVRYRRIPNKCVLLTLACGIVINYATAGLTGVQSATGGCLLGFGLMLVLHLFGAMGAGDVKLFAAICSVFGTHLVIPVFIVVLLTGGVLAIYTTLRNGTLLATLERVIQIFIGLLPGWQVPRFEVPADRRHTVPYGVAITIGSLLSLGVFRA